MNTLADQLNFVTTTLQRSPLCRVVRIIETDNFSRNQFALKVRAELADGKMLQVRLYYNQDHIDYAYQLVSFVGIIKNIFLRFPQTHTIAITFLARLRIHRSLATSFTI